MMNTAKFVRLIVALSAATIGGSLSASVVTSLSPVTVPNTSVGLYVNVLNGTTFTGPATFPAATDPGYNWDLNLYGTATYTFFWSGSTTSGHSTAEPSTGYGIVAASTTNTGNPGLALAPGTTIGSSSIFNTSTSTANLTTGSPVYFGFRFWNEGTDLASAADDTILYGYVQVQLTNGAPGTILSYAYESTPGASITIPAVPEPTTFAAVGLGGGLLLLLSRRRAPAASR